MMWPPPRDRLLQCGPSRRIESYGVAPPPRKIESYSVAPPAGLTLLGLERDRDRDRDRDMGRDRDRDRTFRCGPSQGIRLSAVAPPAGWDFLLWPLPGDWTFRCGPSGGSDFLMWPLPQDRILRCGPPHEINCYTAGSLEYSLRACCCL
jgi:hypothetical protein